MRCCPYKAINVNAQWESAQCLPSAPLEGISYGPYRETLQREVASRFRGTTRPARRLSSRCQLGVEQLADRAFKAEHDPLSANPVVVRLWSVLGCGDGPQMSDRLVALISDQEIRRTGSRTTAANTAPASARTSSEFHGVLRKPLEWPDRSSVCRTKQSGAFSAVAALQRPPALDFPAE